MPLRVVICGPYPYDNSERVVGDGLMQAIVVLAHTLADSTDLDVHVLSRSVSLSRDTTEKRGTVQATWVSDPTPRLDYLIGRRLLRARLASSLKRLMPNVVNAHGEPPFIRAALDSGLPHIVTLHGIFAQQTRANGTAAPLSYRIAYSLMRRWERQYVPKIKNLIAINSEIADHVRSVAPHATVFRVNNAIDPALFHVADHEQNETILFVGQISRRKGLDVLADAFTRIAVARPQCSLRVVGGSQQDPAFQRQLEGRLAELVSKKRVIFLGPMSRADIATELSHCSLLCLPSRYEASP
jgi:glycosyltransferase involved in cell wall biosynthesis